MDKGLMVVYQEADEIGKLPIRDTSMSKKSSTSFVWISGRLWM